MLVDDHRDTLVSIHNIDSRLRELGRLKEAETLSAEAVDQARRTLPEGRWYTVGFLKGSGRTLTKLARHEEAEQALLEAHWTRLAALGADHERTIKAVNALADHPHDAWHEAEPDKGYDAKAAEWRARLAEEGTEARRDEGTKGNENDEP